MMKLIISVFKKAACVFLTIFIFVFSVFPSASASFRSGTNYPYVFVAGYAGWGQYDQFNHTVQYWGMLQGDLIKYLNSKGIESYASSVDPVGSAWDRACELYAQMTGTAVDYGAVHSAVYKHARFGTDYSKKPLLEGWGSADKNGQKKKVNFICHSFGGATARLLTQLLANGDKDEAAGTPPGRISGLFTGGKGDWVHSITTLAAPHNGTTLTFIAGPVYKPISAVKTFIADTGIKIPFPANSTYTDKFGIAAYIKNMSKLFADGIGKDTGIYDLSVDGAAALNKKITIRKDIYYFSIPTDATLPFLQTSARVPDIKYASPIFWPTMLYIGSKTGKTEQGIAIDKNWLKNDGIVNTVSSAAPKNEPQKSFDKKNVTSGTWNIMSTFRGDHGSVVGSAAHGTDIFAYYLAQAELINSLNK